MYEQFYTRSNHLLVYKLSQVTVDTRVALILSCQGDSKGESSGKKNKNDKQCFKWTVIAAVHHEETVKVPQRISKLQRYVDQYNLNRLEFSLAIQKRGKFEKNKPIFVVNIQFNSTKAQRSEFTGKCTKQANLLVVDEENRHYTPIKNLSRLLASLKTVNKGVYHFSMNYRNGFRTQRQQDTSTIISETKMVTSKSNCLLRKLPKILRWSVSTHSSIFAVHRL